MRNAAAGAISSDRPFEFVLFPDRSRTALPPRLPTEGLPLSDSNQFPHKRLGERSIDRELEGTGGRLAGRPMQSTS